MDIPVYEREFADMGYEFTVGVDEAGRGPLAGPVVCAAVVMPYEEDKRILGVNDSKKLSAKKRELLAEKIKATAIAYSIIEIDEGTIDEINILQATRLGMKRAVEALPCGDIVLIDGNMPIEIALPQRCIVKGDALVYSIGAASILAKTYRDARMRRYATEFTGYGFERNMGYGTAEHIAAIRERGICAIHRKTFIKKFWDGGEKPSPANT